MTGHVFISYSHRDSDYVTGAFVPAWPATLVDPVAVPTAAVHHAAETAIRYLMIS